MTAEFPTSTARALVAVPCLNERGHIERVIASLLDDAGWVDPLLVVADGGSTDGTVELVRAIAERDARVRLVHNDKRFQSAGVNLAARLFGEGRRWLIRADAHAHYPPHYVSALVEEATRVGCASVVVGMRTTGSSFFQQSVACAQNSWLGTGGSAHRVQGGEAFVDHGHHALFDLEAFRSVGGYDETFTHNEDAELDIRLRRAGGRIWLTRKVTLDYVTRPTPAALFRQYRSYGRGRARTLLLHRARPKLRQLAPLAVAPAVAALAAAPISPEFALPATLWAGACCGWSLANGVRQRSLRAAMAGPAAMLMHCAWSIGFWGELVQRPLHQAGTSRGAAAPADAGLAR
jgi:succinoglycan biosynthesis protein ExoA